MDETWAIQRSEYGYRDVRPAPLLVEFAGHPYVDVRASLLLSCRRTSGGTCWAFVGVLLKMAA